MLPGVLGFWANDRWHWNQPVWEGTRLEAVAQLEAVEEKQSSFSGRSIAQRDKTTFFGPAGEVLAEYRRTILRLERGEARRRHKYGDYQPARYSEDDLSAIGRQYELEPAQRRGAEPRYWEDVSLGDSLGRLVKGPLTITNVVGFLLGWGSPMCQTNRIAHQYLAEHPGARLFDSERGIEDTLEAAHWDPYFAQMSGLPDGYDFGCQRISWLAHLVTDWCGDEGFLSDLHVFLRRPNHLGDTTWLSGRVVGKRQSEDGGLVDCELTATNQRGDITATGTATVKLPAS
jgi:hypothetical protein